jgi:hypothetical protein
MSVAAMSIPPAIEDDSPVHSGFLFIELPELGDEVPGDIHQSDHAGQSRTERQDPEDTKSCHQRMVSLELLVEVSHVIGAPHFQQDFSVLLHLSLPQWHVWSLASLPVIMSGTLVAGVSSM